jgi:macrodomain Ter protein organizer (MatP/YcbG family)
MDFNLDDLGLTKEVLEERIIASITSRILKDSYFDEDDIECSRNNKLYDKLQKEFESIIDKKIAALIEEQFKDKIESHIEKMVFKVTNFYGEDKASPMSIREHINKHINDTLLEKVDRNGRTERDRYNFDSKSAIPRINKLFSDCVDINIKTAVQSVLVDANKRLKDSLEETIKQKIAEIKIQ